MYIVDVGLLIKEAFFCGSSNGQVQPENIELFIEDHAFLTSYDLAPPQSPPAFSPVSFFRQLSILLTRVGGGGGRSQIIRRRECLVLYKSFSTLWVQQTTDYHEYGWSFYEQLNTGGLLIFLIS